MASVAARTGVWKQGTNVCQEKKKNKIGGERGIILSLSEGTVNSGERRKKWNYKTILGSQLCKTNIFSQNLSHHCHQL